MGICIDCSGGIISSKGALLALEGGMLEALARFPCNRDKTPLTRWRNAASRDVDDTSFPLVGVLTGSPSGFDVLDVDTHGIDWFARQHLALTRMHQTRSGGIHLFFRHAEGLRNSVGRIANGVDVRAEGGLIVWWPREGFPVCEAPIAEWPEELLRLAMKSARKRTLRRSGAVHVSGVDVSGLSKLNVMDYRNRDDWLRLMMAAHSAGVDKEVFIDWSTSDELYADDWEEIERSGMP
jgi:Bifunctional DNA primase/polymerase, N-terminal/Primase C terminal 2 (PriCT-2)